MRWISCIQFILLLNENKLYLFIIKEAHNDTVIGG